MQDSVPVSTPMEAGAMVHMVPYTGEATKQDIHLYQSIIGSEMYCATQTRPDIMFALSVLSRFLTNPSPQHIAAAKRVLRYLKGTTYLGVVYGGGDPGKEDMILMGYSDADYAGYHYTFKSTSGYVFKFAGGVISCQIKRQSIVALSSTESEYYGLAKAAMEAAWLRQLFKELRYKGKDAAKILLYGDNQSSLALAENPELHQRTKHIAVKYYYIRQQHKRELIELWFIPTN
jgi:hypothetical protein